MLSFELSAIDLILTLAVVVLLMLYMTKLSGNTTPEKTIFTKPSSKSITKSIKSLINIKSSYAECPRGFGNIKKIGEDNSVSERCLGCYRITECYSEKQ